MICVFIFSSFEAKKKKNRNALIEKEKRGFIFSNEQQIERISLLTNFNRFFTFSSYEIENNKDNLILDFAFLHSKRKSSGHTHSPTRIFTKKNGKKNQWNHKKGYEKWLGFKFIRPK